MVLAVCAVLVAVLLGLGLGGSVQRLGRLALRNRPLVWAAAVAQLAGVVVGGPIYPVALAMSALLVGAFLALNRGVRGTGLLALGLLSNAVVVGLNGAMPVSLAAAARAEVTTLDLRSGADPRHEPAGRGTALRLLGDVIPVPAPVRPEVVSAGDVLVAAGLGQLVLIGMRPATGASRHGRHRRTA